MELLQDYSTRTISNNAPVIQEVNEINTVNKPEKDEVKCSSTNHIYQNIQKELTKKNSDNSISLRESEKRISTT